MKVISPITIDSSNLTTTNVLEDDYSEYNAGTTYAEGDYIIVAADDTVYQSLQAGNLNKTPSSEPDWWLVIGKTKPWRMFDTVIGTSTTEYELILATGNSGIYTEITPAVRFNGVALMGLSATHVDVVMTSGVDEIYNETFVVGDDLSEPSWYAWYFEEIEKQDKLVVTDMPTSFIGDVLEVSIRNGVNESTVAELVVGQIMEIGESLYGVSVGIKDYSRKEEDKFGNFQITERTFSETMEADIAILTSETYAVKRLLSSLRTTPVVWIADENRQSTIVYGYYRDFDIVISGPVISDASIQIEGLT